MKKRVLIIGGGVIARHYAEGLANSPYFEAVALCDLKDDCPARSVFAHLPFFNDFKEAVRTLKPDAAILAVPPEVRAPIVMFCAKNGVELYSEKPVQLVDELVDMQFRTANFYGRKLITMFHWQYADETLFLKEYLQDKKIKKVSVYIKDDYASTIDGAVREDRLGLGGAWRDSGINALSYINEILPLESVELCSVEAKLDSANRAVCFARREFLVGGVPVEIIVDWTHPSREKQSVIETEDETLFVSHDTQRVWSGDTLVFEKKVADRLTAHYVNLFASPMLEMQGGEAVSRRLHEILFCDKEGKV